MFKANNKDTIVLLSLLLTRSCVLLKNGQILKYVKLFFNIMHVTVNQKQISHIVLLFPLLFFK